MILLTNAKRINLGDFNRMDFNYEKSSIVFVSEFSKEELYFRRADIALEFVLDILEAFHEEATEIDLSHYQTVSNKYDLNELQREIKQRIIEFKEK